MRTSHTPAEDRAHAVRRSAVRTVSPAGGHGAGTILHLQRLAGNRAVTAAVTAQRDLADMMREGIAERRGRATGRSAGDADREDFATDRFASSAGRRATEEASALHPAKPDGAALESTLGVRSRLGEVATDAPGLGPAHDRAGGALRSKVASDRWASGQKERTAGELGHVGKVDVDRGQLEDNLALNINAGVSSAKELGAEVKGRATRHNRMALQSRLAQVKGLPLTAAQKAKLSQVEGHLNATVQGTLSFSSESDLLTAELESIAAWSALGPVVRDARALRDTTAQLNDDVLTFFDAPGQTARQVRIAIVTIAADAAARVKALSDNNVLDPTADEALRTRLHQQTLAWGTVSQEVSVGRVFQVSLAIGKEWVRDHKLFENVANKAAQRTHTNKAALVKALQDALDSQRKPPPATWLKAVGFDMIHDLYLRPDLPAVDGCKVHSSVYKSEVAKLGAASWPLMSATQATIVNFLLPDNLKAGFHVTLEGFPKFPDNRNGSPHFWRGGTKASGNWAKRPSGVPNDWDGVSTRMGDRLDGEIERVGAAVTLIQEAGGIRGWPF